MAALTQQVLDAQLLRVREKLEVARKHDRACKTFGSSRHGYRLGPTLPVAQLVKFEAETGVALPDDFRRFVQEIGNGGAGPAYGWPAFNPAGAIFRQAAWRGPFQVPRDGEEDDEEPRGYIELSEHGCGIFDFLVVSGPECGHVWYSDDCCDLYPLPGADWDSLKDLPTDWTSSVVWRQRLRSPTNVSRISFVDYIEKWLDEVLADAKLSSP